LAPMLVTLGNRGSSGWRRGRWADIYDERLDLVELVRDPQAKGRSHVLFSSDEILPNALNPGRAPWHILGVRTHSHKLVTYSHWAKGTTRPVRRGMALEFYDYSTAGGRSETRSNPDDPRVKPLVGRLFNRYVPTQMEAPLPRGLRPASRRARAGYLAFAALSEAYTVEKLLSGADAKLRTELGYGGAF